MAEHFAPVDHFWIILIKVPPSRFLAKMFIFVLVPWNLIMSNVQQKNIFYHSSHRLVVLQSILFVYSPRHKL